MSKHHTNSAIACVQLSNSDHVQLKSEHAERLALIHERTTPFPVNTTPWPNAGLMLAQRRRRWPSIKPALEQHLVHTGDRKMGTLKADTTKQRPKTTYIWINSQDFIVVEMQRALRPAAGLVTCPVQAVGGVLGLR